MSQEWKERRRYRRFQVNCPVSFISFNRLGIAETSDLSLGGMKLQSRSILFTGEAYDFTLIVNGCAISSKGRVLRIENQSEFTYGASVSFVHLPEDHQHHLNGFLATQKSW